MGTPWGIPGRTARFRFPQTPTLHLISVVMVGKPSSGAALLLVHMVIERSRQGYMPADRHMYVILHAEGSVYSEEKDVQQIIYIVITTSGHNHIR